MIIDLLNYKEFSTWIIYLIFILLIIIFINRKNREEFIFMPWNMSTRFYPSYDIRGYPYIPFMYITPYNYYANGEYKINKIK